MRNYLLAGTMLGIAVAMGTISAPCLAASGSGLPASLGAPAAGIIDLVVDPFGGHIKLVGGTGASVSSYQIDSAGGALDATKWASLGLSTLGSTSNSIGEGALTGVGPTLSGTSLDIGAIFRPNGAHDLAFMAFDNAGNEVEGTVTYIAVPEPTVLGILALTGMGLIARRRKIA